MPEAQMFFHFLQQNVISMLYLYLILLIVGAWEYICCFLMLIYSHLLHSNKPNLTEMNILERLD